jgi:transketolase
MNIVPKQLNAGLTAPASAALRALAMDMVEAAKSGHPGAPLGLADVASVLWPHYLHHNPANPAWPDRDRFVLSNGHASALLYAILHLTGYDLPIEELKRFRQLHSKTPGHPEFGVTPGVETTTGPLGQGFANAVGMAIAEKTLAAQFNRPGHSIVDHRTYVIIGDGCLMEGISHEAASLAGRLGLGKLIALYDDNGISIDGKVTEWFADDTPKRFEAYGWHVVRAVNGHCTMAVDAALSEAIAETDQPSLICLKTVIGRGAPTKQGHQDTHGAPLGAEEVARTREALGWRHAPFVVPADVISEWDATRQGQALEANWQKRFDAYRTAHPELAAEFLRRVSGELPGEFAATASEIISATARQGPSIASRKASQNALSAWAKVLPELMGGSADLTHSNLTQHPLTSPITRDSAGNTVLFGVREFAMAAIANGIALHGGFLSYVATFLVFSDYARNAIRMSALMRQRVVYVFTHDSIGLGEDGPTHQPIEHLESLRLIPNLDVWRPSDAVETDVAWAQAIGRSEGPSVLALSRQTLPHQRRTEEQVEAIARGGYVLIEPQKTPAVVIVATGSEVKLARAAAELLALENIPVRVVSMPCVEAFEREPTDWQNRVLPVNLPVVAVEAGATRGWRRYAGRCGVVVGIDRFGESAPEKDLFAHFGFTPERVADAVRSVVRHPDSRPIR